MGRRARSGAKAGVRLVIAPEHHNDFWSKVTRSDGCWTWNGSYDHGGYGLYTAPLSGQPRRAHRVAFAVAHGECPSGKVVMHVCDNRACVNPDHLRLGTQRENVHDSVKKGRATGRSVRRETQDRLRQDDAIKYLDYLHANLCGFAKALNLGPMPYDFETWRKARYGMEKSA